MKRRKEWWGRGRNKEEEGDRGRGKLKGGSFLTIPKEEEIARSTESGREGRKEGERRKME